MKFLKKLFHAYLIFLFVAGHIVAGLGVYFLYDRIGKSPRQILVLGAERLNKINPANGSQVLELMKTSREKSLSKLELPALTHWKGSGASKWQKNWIPTYDSQGRPVSSTDFITDNLTAYKADEFPGRIVPVSSNKKLIKAITNARPRDSILIEPSIYYFEGRSIRVKSPGLPHAPISVRAKKLGSVTLKFNLLEGFLVSAPFWIFENLQIEGVCPNHSRCEHAFHVSGKTKSLVIRNNRLYDFNAQLKVNGGGRYFKNNKFYQDCPDFGLVEGNTVADRSPRATGNPVTKLNINGANSWVVRGNLIADFEKLSGNQISYAAFMKANSRNGVFENNAIICHMNGKDAGGTRLGLSFGGGGTDPKFCRKLNCDTEHTGGIMRNNIIMNCPKYVGVFLRRSKGTQIFNNGIYNTTGVDLLFSTSSAYFANNIIEGRVKNRFGSKSEIYNNIIIEEGIFRNKSTFHYFKDPINANFKLLNKNSIVGKGTSTLNLGVDFCGNTRNDKSPDIGPLDFKGDNTCDVRDIWKNH
jgi:hypothetical protein